MYTPAAFAEDDPDRIAAFLVEHPMAQLVTMTADGLVATPLPMMYEPATTGLGSLVGHVARANRQWAEATTSVEALAIFTGPNAYVSPNWYPSKAAHGKVVPTWNYTMVQARGLPRVIDDPDWIRDQIDMLTSAQEQVRPEPWAVSDAPVDFVSAQLNAIVGVEIPITSLEGKWKVSQNRSEADQAGVRAGLQHEGGCPHTPMAALIGGAREDA